MLHVVPDEWVKRNLGRAGLPGEIIAWSDELYTGPVPAGLTDEELRETRAEALTALWQADIETCRARLASEDTALEAHPEHDEVVIWCSISVADQLRLIRHLDWFARRDLGRTRLSVVCASEWLGLPQLFSLGWLETDDFAALFPARREMTPEQVGLARQAWTAFRSPDPRAIEAFIEDGFPTLQYAVWALNRFLREFPSVRNGLTRTESLALAFMPGRATLSAILGDLLLETSEMGFASEGYLLSLLDGLARGQEPAITIGDATEGDGPNRMRTQVEITRTGRLLLAGRDDWVLSNGIDRWLGGVHLQGNEAAWRWSEDARRLVRMGEG